MAGKNGAWTKKELAELAGYTYRALHGIDEKLPDGEKLFEAEEGGYSLGAFVRAWAAYNARHAQEKAGSWEKVKARHEELKMQKTALELKRMKGALVETEKVKKLWAAVARVIAGRLQGLGDKLAPSLLNLPDLEDIKSRINTEARDMMAFFADCPLPKAEEALMDEQEDEEAEQDEE